MRAVKKATFGLGILGLLCLGAVCVVENHDDVFTDEGLLEADAADLKQTIVTPHLETPIASGESVLWCGTFQLAWNEACAIVGEDLHFAGEHAMVAILNKKVKTTLSSS